MDLQNSVRLLTRQSALTADYALIVAVIALVIFCISVLYKARMVEQLRQTGEQHDNLQMRYFNPAQKIVVQRPDEQESEEPSQPDHIVRRPHIWRAQR
jgi:flagellar biosynthesis/type III secretory pathway M-ring protein FliF/YscJ